MMLKYLPLSIFIVTLLAGCVSQAQPMTNISVLTTAADNATNTPTLSPTDTPIPAPTDTPTPLSTETPTPTPTSTLLAIEGLGQETTSLPTGGDVNYPPVVGDGSLWVPVMEIGNVLRVDLESGELLATIPVGKPFRSGAPCCGANSVAFANGFVWVTQGIDQAILIIDPATNEVVDAIPVGMDVYDLTLDGNTLWATAFEADSVLRIDIETKEVVATIGDVKKPTGITVGGGAVWVVQHRPGFLVRIDPATNTIDAKFELTSVEGQRPNPENVVFAFGSVWVANNNGETVSRIDPATNKQIAIFFRGLGPLRVTAGSTGIWVVYWEKDRDSTRTIGWINPENNIVTKWNFADVGNLFEHEGVLWAIAGSPKGELLYRIEME